MHVKHQEVYLNNFHFIKYIFLIALSAKTVTLLPLVDNEAHWEQNLVLVNNTSTTSVNLVNPFNKG